MCSFRYNVFKQITFLQRLFEYKHSLSVSCYSKNSSNIFFSQNKFLEKFYNQSWSKNSCKSHLATLLTIKNVVALTLWDLANPDTYKHKHNVKKLRQFIHITKSNRWRTSSTKTSSCCLSNHVVMYFYTTTSKIKVVFFIMTLVVSSSFVNMSRPLRSWIDLLRVVRRSY